MKNGSRFILHIKNGEMKLLIIRNGMINNGCEWGMVNIFLVGIELINEFLM